MQNFNSFIWQFAYIDFFSPFFEFRLLFESKYFAIFWVFATTKDNFSY